MSGHRTPQHQPQTKTTMGRPFVQARRGIQTVPGPGEFKRTEPEVKIIDPGRANCVWMSSTCWSKVGLVTMLSRISNQMQCNLRSNTNDDIDFRSCNWGPDSHGARAIPGAYTQGIYNITRMWHRGKNATWSGSTDGRSECSNQFRLIRCRVCKDCIQGPRAGANGSPRALRQNWELG